MTKRDSKRWLQVAIRASEFGVLSSANELSPVADRALATAHALRVAREASEEARSLWRARRSQAIFHVGQENQSQQFAQYLLRLEAAQLQQDHEAQSVLEDRQAALRQQIAQKNGLKRAYERSLSATASEALKQQQRADDDTWSARQNPHERGSR